MGRRRKRNNRRGKKQQVWRQFQSHSTWQAFEDETERERYRVEQKEHLKTIAELKVDLLSRTVLVGSVLPLGVEKNKDALRRFMEHHHGPVQKVGIDKKRRGKFPRGRITFNFKHDAEKLFGGMSLMKASKDRIQVQIPCASVGYKGSITVWPSSEYKGMMQDDLNTNSVIQVNTDDLSLGHWFPRGTDACNTLPGLEDIAGKDQAGTWVEENPTQVNPILCINMENAVVELDVTHCVQSAMGDIPYLEDMMVLALDVMIEKRVILSFRFKDLAHPMVLCRRKGWSLYTRKFYIMFSLKNPPRLSSIFINRETGWETRTRLTNIGSGASALLSGTCLGYCLEVSGVEIDRLTKESSELSLSCRHSFIRMLHDNMSLEQ